MEIVPYPHLAEKDQMFPLMFRGFVSHLDPREFDERRGRDFRLKGGPGGFCAVESGRLLGFAGVMDIPTRSLDGPEMVGGIHNVVTDPAVTRRGVCTALMEEAHRYFRDRGYRFVFLTTWRSMVAHRLYVKLGYGEVEAVNRFSKAFKLVNRSRRLKAQGRDIVSPTDEDVSHLFAEFTADRTGFVVRPHDYLGYQEWRGRVDRALSVKVEGGYALVSDHNGPLDIVEMVALDSRAQELLLEVVEMRAKGTVVDPLVAGERLLRGYQIRNYTVSQGSYVVLMAKPLEPGVTVEEAYGDSFYISSLQYF